MPGIETTYNRILSYLKGLLSDRQRHDLEKDVMRDVFDGEALEGLSQLSAEELETDMDVLMNRLEYRVMPVKKRDIKFYFRIAAGILLLTGLGVSLYFLLKPPAAGLLTEDKSIAKHVSAAPAKEPAPPLTDTFKKDIKPKKRISDNSTGNRAELAENRPQARSVIATLDTISVQEDLLASDELVVVDYGNREKNNVPGAMPENKSESKAMSSETLSRNMQGKVAGVQVTQNEATKKDEIGSDNAAFSGLIKPVPPGGSLKSFRKWVTDRIDHTAFKPYPGKQRLVVNLTVHTDGTISDIRIRESVPQEIASEFRNVILQSPKWTPALIDNTPVEAEVAIRFVITDE